MEKPETEVSRKTATGRRIGSVLGTIVSCLGILALVILCVGVFSIDTTVNQHTYLSSFGLNEKSRYVMPEYPSEQVPSNGNYGPPTVPTGTTQWMQSASGGYVRFAIIVKGLRERVVCPLSRIVWVEKAGATVPTIQLSLTKGEDITINAIEAKRWEKNPDPLYIDDAGQTNPDPEKVRKLLLWNERVDFYSAMRSRRDAVGALIERDAYKITITADPGKIAELKRQAAGQP